MDTQTKTRISTKTLLLIGVSVLIIGGGIIAYYGYVPPSQGDTAEGEVDSTCFNECMADRGSFNACLCICGGPCWGNANSPDSIGRGCPSVLNPQTGQKVCSISKPCWVIDPETGQCQCIRRLSLALRIYCSRGFICYCPGGEVFGGGTGP